MSDWGKRATAKGYRIRYIAAMKVYHPARARFTELCQKWDRHMAHEFILARSRRGGRLKWAVKMLAMGVSPLAELPRIAVSDRISGWPARGLACLGLVRIRAYRAVKMAGLLAGGDPERLAGRWNRPASEG